METCKYVVQNLFFELNNLFATSESPNIQIPILQFSKSLFLFIEGGQENIFYWLKIFFGPIILLTSSKQPNLRIPNPQYFVILLDQQ